MSLGSAVTSWFERIGLEILGWILIPLGIILMPLPGPGMVVVAGGVALLSRRYVWAQRVRGFVEKRAFDAARYGVATIPRILLSILGGVWLFALGVVWWKGVNIPEFDVLNIGFGPELPGGRPAAFGLWASALATWALIAYSVKRWRLSAT
jgi:uncharacterized protein (TIGR02611 family)